MKAPAPGDHEVPVPPPLDTQPPADRFCDLVMTGGVASGVVYPWAVLEIARAYRFRNIGGTSVGAMAAALAAAAEYGRRVGFDQSFEALRRSPGSLAEVLPDGRTRMLSLFQAHPRGRRLMRLWGLLFAGQHEADLQGLKPTWLRRDPPLRATRRSQIAAVLRTYFRPLATGAGVVLTADAALAQWHDAAWSLPAWAAAVGAAVGAGAAFAWALWRDLDHGLLRNNLGLVKGGTLEAPGPEGRRPGLSEWLHDGIQASAGLKRTDAPLTFRSLWCAPLVPGGEHRKWAAGDAPGERSINLQFITTNATHGRPYRLPLDDQTSRLFYLPQELADYFPQPVLDALVAVSSRYEPRSAADPAAISRQDEFLELPQADLPVVVAARLSLSFPLLFAAVPLWALDYEADFKARDLRRCLFTDGGVSSNFPIHLFDSAIPRWPTFGLWLDRRDVHRPVRDEHHDLDVWLPEYEGQGWGDSWQRFDPLAADPRAEVPPSDLRMPGSRLGLLFGFIAAVATSATDWRDRTNMRLPHVRNRVARLRLREGETGLHIGMSSRQILRMAHRYGTVAGQLFVQRFKDQDGQPSRAWREQRWIRWMTLLAGLKERLRGVTRAAQSAGYTVPLPVAIRDGLQENPVATSPPGPPLDLAEVQSLERLLAALEDAESALGAEAPSSYQPVPTPELRLRAPL